MKRIGIPDRSAPLLNSCPYCAHKTVIGEKCEHNWYREYGHNSAIYQMNGWTCDAFIQQGSVEGEKQ